MDRERDEEKKKENRWSDLTTIEKHRLETWKEGQKLRFPSENKELGIKAEETAKIERMDKDSGVITLRKENGQEVAMKPEYMKREMERKALEIDSDQKTMEQMEQRKEEKDASKEKSSPEKEKEHAQEKEGSSEQGERQQEKAREEKKEASRRERERGRDGMGY